MLRKNNIVLLVDNSSYILKILTPELQKRGFSVITAVSPQEALDKLIANPEIQFVLTDYDMSSTDNENCNGIDDLIKPFREYEKQKGIGESERVSFVLNSAGGTGREREFDALGISYVDKLQGLEAVADAILTVAHRDIHLPIPKRPKSEVTAPATPSLKPISLISVNKDTLKR